MKEDKGFKNVSVRFFVFDLDNENELLIGDIKEVGEDEFIQYEGKIEYERHSVFENGCAQICLTKNPY